MPHLEDLPAELVIRVLHYTEPADLGNISQVNHRWYSLAAKRLRLHKEYRSKYKTLNDGYLWRDVLVNVLRDPWLGHYVHTLSLNEKGFRRKRLLSGTYVPRYSAEDPVESHVIHEALKDFKFMKLADFENPPYRKRVADEAPAMAFLLALLPNVRHLTMNVPSTWRGMKLISKVVSSLAIAHSRNPNLGSGLKKLQYMEFQGHCSRRGSAANINYLASFITLPNASAVKLRNIAALKFSADPALPLSGLTSLVLVQCPFEPQAVSALLCRTPWLRRFVSIGAGRDSVEEYLQALIANVSQSLQFLAIDVPRSYPIMETCSNGSVQIEALVSLRALFIGSGLLLSAEKPQLPEMRLRTIIFDGLLYSLINVHAIREFVSKIRCENLHIHGDFNSACTTLDLELIIETELLKEACSQADVTVHSIANGVREYVVAGLNEKWMEYI